MEFTEEQKNYLADVYANGKSSSDVFKESHKVDFIAGFEKALSLFSNQKELTPNPFREKYRKEVIDLIERLSRLEQLNLPDGTKGAVWLDDVIEVVREIKL